MIATNSILFCIKIVGLTDAEKAWVLEKQAEQERYWDGDDQCEMPWHNLEGVNFFIVGSVGDGQAFLIIESDEYADVEAAAAFIQEFLREFRPAEVVLFEWAETCDRMLPGQFGGGACKITASDVKWVWTRSRLYG